MHIVPWAGQKKLAESVYKPHTNPGHGTKRTIPPLSGDASLSAAPPSMATVILIGCAVPEGKDEKHDADDCAE